MKRIVLIPDTHVPIDDRSVVRAIIRFIGNTQPDEVVHLGDLMDYPSPSRWTKGTKEEFQARIKPDSEQAKTRFLGPLREVYSGPVRVHVGNHDCVDTNTRAVTRRGIKHVDDLEPDDEVMSVDDEGNTVWQLIDKVVRYPFKGNLYSYGGQDISAAVTANHRVVGLTKSKSRWAEYTPESLPGSKIWVFSAGRGSTNEYEISDDEIRLAAWAITDSHRSKLGNWIFYQSGPKSDRIRLLLKTMGIVAKERARDRDITHIDGKLLKSPPQTQYEFSIGNHQQLDTLVPDKNKLPDWVYLLSERQARLFIDEIVFCDGSKKKSGSRMIYVCREELREGLMTLCASNGIRASATEYRPGHFRVNLCDRALSGLYKNTLEEVAYEGEVWCLQVPNGRFFVEREGKIHLTGNSRPETYLGQYAPALVEYAEQFKLSALLDFDGFGVETLPDFYKIAPGWLSTHGHRGGIRLSQKSGETALMAALKFGTSVIMGHVHRLGLKGHTTGYGGNGNTLWGMEIGHIMNMKQAHYLKGATANWQQGFGLLTVDGAHVKPELVPINARRFSVDGEWWAIG